MMMHLVIPSKKVLAEGPGIFETAKLFGKRGLILVGLDGTEYFSSDALHCPQCSHRTHKGGQLSYQHTVNLPVIVAPGQEQVISLMPEFIRPQDGAEKQDSRPLAD